MSSQLYVPEIKGLLLGLDRKKLSDKHVVDGQNFIMSIDGPISGLGRDITAFEAISSPTNVQEFQISETKESYICTNEGIYRFDTDTEKLIPAYPMVSPNEAEFPWSFAPVGSKVYFARKGQDLIEYDTVLDSWESVSGGSIPTDIYACTESEGRLILLTSAVSAWSAIGDGQDFTPSTTTGAGSQALTKMGLASPKPLGVQKTPDGYLTFVSSGIMKSQAVNAANPFRHVVLTREHEVINPYCIAITEAQKIVFVTAAGMFETEGGLPKTYQPLMSEHLHENIIPRLDIENNQNNIRLYADFARSWFIISIATNQRDYSYDLAYILNLKTGEWGSLNTNYVAFLNFKTLTQNQAGFNYSLVDADGTIARFSGTTGIEYVPVLDYGLYYHKILAEKEIRINDDVYYAPMTLDLRMVSTVDMETSGVYDTFSETREYVSPLIKDTTEKPAEQLSSGSLSSGDVFLLLDYLLITDSVATFEDWGLITDSVGAGDEVDYSSGDSFVFRMHFEMSMGVIDLDVISQIPYYDPLNSSIEVGVLRLSDETANDRLTYITNVALSMLEGAVSSTAEDWFSEKQYPSDLIDDWLTSSEPDEDWGGDPVLTVNYQAEINSSLDGYEPDTDQDSTMEEITSSGRVKFFSCYSQGLYHTIKITALNEGENFHLKTMDNTINLGGRL